MMTAQLPHANPHTARQLPPYYSTINLAPDTIHKFRDIDHELKYKECRAALKDVATRSLLLDFGTDHAWCAFDLKACELDALLKAPRPPSLSTRWINFWGADFQDQKEGIKAVASHYGLSARLKSLLSSDAYKAPFPNKDASTLSSCLGKASIINEKQPNGTVRDLESAVPTAIRIADDIHEMIDIQNVTFGQIVNEIWHFCSVDWGHRYLCLGYNSLFSVPEGKVDNGLYKPRGKRVWTRLILCDDGTVVSIYENPFPSGVPFDLEVLKIVRRNAMNVFHHLSKLCKSSEHRNALMTVQIRDFDHSFQPGNGKDSASLILYYLFDDWVTTYSLVAKKEHPYGLELDRIRARMGDRASVGLVDSLHLIGRRLAVLKRIYQSYELVINRILQRQKMIKSELRRKAQQAPNRALSSVTQDDNGDVGNTSTMPHDSSMMELSASGDMALGVQLSATAIVRFERLLDRIRLYALSEIDECLAEKESLVFMNFNLIALKESQAVEKLTRITILLAKATILFLPVSLMTAYFSVQISDLQNVYSAKTYWLCFLVVVLLSILLLVVFGVASDTVEGKTIYRSLGKTLFDVSRAAMGRQKSKRKST